MLCIVAGGLLLQASLVWLLFSLPSVFSQRLRKSKFFVNIKKLDVLIILQHKF